MALDGNGLIAVCDMPSTRIKPVTAPFVDAYSVKNFLTYYAPETVVIEAVATRPGQGISSSGKFMCAYGVVVGIAYALGINVVLVPPVVWKRKFGLIGKPKDVARKLAIKRFGGESTFFKRKKDGGRADAALIAEYGRALLV